MYLKQNDSVGELKRLAGNGEETGLFVFLKQHAHDLWLTALSVRDPVITRSVARLLAERWPATKDKASTKQDPGEIEHSLMRGVLFASADSGDRQAHAYALRALDGILNRNTESLLGPEYRLAIHDIIMAASASKDPSMIRQIQALIDGHEWEIAPAFDTIDIDQLRWRGLSLPLPF